MTLYDYTYIDDKIIGTIEKNLPNVSEILKVVEKRATGKVTSTLSQSVAEGQIQMGVTGGAFSSKAEDEEQKVKRTTE